MIRRHWPFAVVLAAGALLRIAAEIAYRPALFYSDSWGYLNMAHGSGIVTFAPLRPSGYPVVLKLLSVAGDGLAAATLVQHLAGLATGALAYATLIQLDVRRSFATVAGAFVVLDAWAIALEQYVLAEAFLGLLLAAAVWASLTGARRPGREAALAFAGLCLAAAALMKPVALFAAVAWIAWLWIARIGGRAALSGIAAFALPLLIYATVHASVTGTFGLTQSDGWFLYGRVGSIATCEGIDVEREARGLCKRPPGADDESQSFFMFNRRSPAHTAFGGISEKSKRQAKTNRILRHFALQVIAHRPGEYVKLAGGDFLRFMRPGPHAPHGEDQTVQFPRRARIRFDDRQIRRRLFPDLQTHASAPAGALRSYGSVAHTSRVLVAIVTILSLIALALGLRRREQAAKALFLPLASALFVLLGAAATASFALRYLVPVVAQLAVAGTLSLELAARLRGKGRRAVQTPPRPAAEQEAL